MKDAKELFELALTSHRRMEKLTLVEKGALISIINALFQAEVQEAQLAERAMQREFVGQVARAPITTVPVGDEYHQ